MQSMLFRPTLAVGAAKQCMFHQEIFQYSWEGMLFSYSLLEKY